MYSTFPQSNRLALCLGKALQKLLTPSHKGGALLHGPTRAQQVRTAEPLLHEARKTHQPMRWQLPRIQVPTVAGKGIWDCTNGTRNSLPTGIFCHGIFKHLNLFHWAALVEEEGGDKSHFQEWTPAEMGQRAFLHVGLPSLQFLSNSQ